MSIEGQGHFFTIYLFQVLYILYFTRPRYQVSVYRTVGPLVYFFDVLLCAPVKQLRLCQDGQFLDHTVPGGQFTSIYSYRFAFIEEPAVILLSHSG